MACPVDITGHAWRRMEEYDISRQELNDAIENPDSRIEGHSGRRIAQKRQDGKVLRVIYETDEDIKTVVTTYRARADRYEV